MITLDQKLEGVLFFKAAPVKKRDLCKLFDVSAEELEEAVKILQQRLDGTAIMLVASDTEVELATISDLDELIEAMRKDELKRDIGKAGAETLAIVLYRGPVARAEIDRIRGVNSAYILRNLLMRGLIEKDSSGKQIQFRITTELLKHLGIKEKTDLKDYGTVMDALTAYEEAQTQESEEKVNT